MKHRHEKRTEYIKELVAQYLGRESNGTSLITVTRLDISDREDQATIYLSIMPENKERAALDFVTRQLSDIRNYVMEHIPQGKIPFFRLALDQGEKLRRKIDALDSGN